MKRRLILATLAAAVATPALAVDEAKIEARYTPAFQTCLDAPGGATTAGMVQCIAAELHVQDRALNTAWRALIADMTPDQQAGLQTAQRAWIAVRDADCQSRFSPDWGSMSTIDANACMLRRTTERAIELEEFRADAADGSE